MAIYSGFSHKKLWFSIATLNYQRVELQNPIPRFGYSTMWSRCCSSILLGSYQLRTASQNCRCRSPGVPLFQAAYSRCGPCPNYHRLLPGVDALVGWRLLVWRCLEMFGVWISRTPQTTSRQSGSKPAWQPRAYEGKAERIDSMKYHVPLVERPRLLNQMLPKHIGGVLWGWMLYDCRNWLLSGEQPIPSDKFSILA